MNTNGKSLNGEKINGHSFLNNIDLIELELNEHDFIGDNHIGTSDETPMKADAFILSDREKMAIIEDHFRQIMDTLGLDLTDDSLKGTPKRVAKMFVKEIFSGLNPENKPSISVFENKYKSRG